MTSRSIRPLLSKELLKLVRRHVLRIHGASLLTIADGERKKTIGVTSRMLTVPSFTNPKKA